MDRDLATRVAKLGLVFCVAGAGLGLIGLCGWITGVRALTDLVAGRPQMMPNTAVGLLLAGLGGVLRRKPSAGCLSRGGALAAGLVVSAIGAATLGEYIAGRGFGIDELLFHGDPATPHPGRPSPPTALALLLLGIALALFDAGRGRGARPAEWPAVAAGLIGFVTLVAHAHGAGVLYTLAGESVIGVAVPTSAGLLLLSLGFLMLRPDARLMLLVTSPGPGGMLMRRLGIGSLIAPPLIGLVALRLISVTGLRDVPLALAVLTSVMVPVGVLFVYITAARLERTHAALEVSRQRVASLVDQASDGIFVADLDGRYVDVNGAGCRMLGHTRDEIIGKTILDLIPPEDAERLRVDRERMLKGAVSVADWRLRHKDGSFIPVEVSAKILADGRWQGLVRDISARKAAEEEARRSRARLEATIAQQTTMERELREARDFLDNVLQSVVGYGVVALDLRRNVVLWNEGARRNHGYEPEEIVGQPIDTLHVPDDLASGVARSLYAGALDRGTAEVVSSLKRKDGSQFVAQIVASRRVGHDGRPVGYLLVSRDVSDERAQADHERLLAEAGAALASTLDAGELAKTFADLVVRYMVDGCIVDVTDEDGSCRTRAVQHRDPRTARLARGLQEVLPDRTKPHLAWAALERRQSVVVSHVADDYVDSLPQSPEYVRLVRGLDIAGFMAMPIMVRGELLGAVVFISSTPGRRFRPGDLTRAEELVARLALALDNARLYRAVGQALAGRDDVLRIVAHDLRSPLGAAQLAAQSLLRRSAAPDTRPLAETIQRSLRRAARLIEDLLDVSKIEAGRLQIVPAAMAPETLVEDAIELLAPAAEAASLALTVELEPGLPQVWADAGRIVQVLSNLIGNAVKFVPAGGHIRVTARRDRGTVRFAVQDDGPGIPPEHLPHLFDRFWQGKIADRRGAGLGLAIVKGLIDAHGGAAWVESRPGEGTTFFFTLRLASGSPTPAGDVA